MQTRLLDQCLDPVLELAAGPGGSQGRCRGAEPSAANEGLGNDEWVTDESRGLDIRPTLGAVEPDARQPHTDGPWGERQETAKQHQHEGVAPCEVTALVGEHCSPFVLRERRPELAVHDKRRTKPPVKHGDAPIEFDDPGLWATAVAEGLPEQLQDRPEAAGNQPQKEQDRGNRQPRRLVWVHGAQVQPRWHRLGAVAGQDPAGVWVARKGGASSHCKSDQPRDGRGEPRGTNERVPMSDGVEPEGQPDRSH